MVQTPLVEEASGWLVSGSTGERILPQNVRFFNGVPYRLGETPTHEPRKADVVRRDNDKGRAYSADSVIREAHDHAELLAFRERHAEEAQAAAAAAAASAAELADFRAARALAAQAGEEAIVEDGGGDGGGDGDGDGDGDVDIDVDGIEDDEEAAAQ